MFNIRTSSDMAKVPDNAIVDVRMINERGYYVYINTLGDNKMVGVSTIESRYRIGKGLHDKLAKNGGRCLTTSFYPMGDNYRWLAKYEGLDYSDVTFVVAEAAKDLPNLLGVNGVMISRGDIKCLRMYLAMSYYEDSRFKMVPYAPLYPGIMFHGDLDVSFFHGVTRRSREPALSVVEPIDDVDRNLKRQGFIGPRSILLNPYGNSIEVRDEREKTNSYEIMNGLANKFLRRGYQVYTNTPFPKQKELPGTKRYEGDIPDLINQAASFDLVVTVFTGFMEVVMSTSCNLVVLNYSNQNTRMNMASSLEHSNYWEFNVIENSPKFLISEITKTFESLSVKKRLKYPRDINRLLTLKEKSKLFKVTEITPELVRIITLTSGRNEISDILEKGTKDPLLCCIGARVLEKGIQTEIDIPRAIKWYRRANFGGVTWAKSKVMELKEKRKQKRTV